MQSSFSFMGKMCCVYVMKEGYGRSVAVAATAFDLETFDFDFDFDFDLDFDLDFVVARLMALSIRLPRSFTAALKSGAFDNAIGLLLFGLQPDYCCA